ncbi:MAG: ATP-binding protein [Candidatus Eisenbacteria bacterium]|uniref:ATP-binding protein n=1 Tax=Eiseniibacteriota bacterium TaxID=2212470 RepID=A0A948RVE4_UNCEI|nr:ATP-binding protein [Candidatus Eisenbacteria bacterium]MBU1949746.1 ATP-binding protein [Candidatus Eisenbacteria bacterium]MBU2691575.1 ATP-binding protein [Candidatus Eisenbacteria bacterium]
MKEIVVISGKGGTGKTSITASFAVLGGKNVVVADCDVDAADMHLLLEPDFGIAEAFYSGELAVIDQELCSGCGACAGVCRYDAIPVIDGKYIVDAISCEGCGYCARVCPEKAITNVEQNVGNWYLSKIRTGSSMAHARLKSGADNSGKLVAKVKNEARKTAEQTGRRLILVDGSPGIGCPVVSSLSGASLAVMVTEPTLSGLHDLKRVYNLVHKFGIKAGCIINKADLNQDVLRELRSFLDQEEIVNLAEIPYDDSFTAAITNGRTIVEWDSSLKERISACWASIRQIVGMD